MSVNRRFREWSTCPARNCSKTRDTEFTPPGAFAGEDAGVPVDFTKHCRRCVSAIAIRRCGSQLLFYRFLDAWPTGAGRRRKTADTLAQAFFGDELKFDRNRRPRPFSGSPESDTKRPVAPRFAKRDAAVQAARRPSYPQHKQKPEDLVGALADHVDTGVAHQSFKGSSVKKERPRRFAWCRKGFARIHQRPSE
jgi:hypothetical protein